jgi:hypothetical protein
MLYSKTAHGAQAINITKQDLKGVCNMITRSLKRLSLKAALLAGSLCAITFAANAQSAIAKASVPFEFAAGGAMMPPGEYTVDVLDLSGVLMLHGSAGNSVALFSTFSQPAAQSTTAKLVFERRAGMLYLSAVEFPDHNARLVSPFMRVVKGAASAALH